MSRYFSRLARRSGLPARTFRPQQQGANTSDHQPGEILALDLAVEKVVSPSLPDAGVLKSQGIPIASTHSDDNAEPASLAEDKYSSVNNSGLRISNQNNTKIRDDAKFSLNEKREFGDEVVEKPSPKIWSLSDQNISLRINDLPLSQPVLKKTYVINEQQMEATFLDKPQATEKRTVKGRMVEAKPLSLSVAESTTLQRPMSLQDKNDGDKQKVKDQNKNLIPRRARMVEVNPPQFIEAQAIKESLFDEQTAAFGREQNHQHKITSAVNIKIGKISVDVHQAIPKNTMTSNTARKSPAASQQKTQPVRLSRYYLREL